MKEIESIGPDAKARRKLLAGAGIGLLSLLSFFKSGLFPKKKAGHFLRFLHQQGKWKP